MTLMTTYREDNDSLPDQTQAATQLVQVLAALARTERDVVRLVYFDGLTQAQVADTLGLSPDTVHDAVARGLREVARRLSGGPSFHWR